MVNPPYEIGFTQIPNEIIQALCRLNLSKYEWRVLLYILRMTYGYHRDSVCLALSLISKYVGLDRRHAHRAAKSLKKKGVLIISRDNNSKYTTYMLQKDHTKWCLSSSWMTDELYTVIHEDDKSSSKGMTTVISTDDKLSSVEIHNKGIKENIKETKNMYSPCDEKAHHTESVNDNMFSAEKKTNNLSSLPSSPSTNKDTQKVKKRIVYTPEFETDFWDKYPARNGKKLGKENAFKKFLKISEEEKPLLYSAVKNYGDSEMVSKGIGIKDPERFLGGSNGYEYWREWITPEVKRNEKMPTNKPAFVSNMQLI